MKTGLEGPVHPGKKPGSDLAQWGPSVTWEPVRSAEVRIPPQALESEPVFYQAPQATPVLGKVQEARLRPVFTKNKNSRNVFRRLKFIQRN